MRTCCAFSALALSAVCVSASNSPREAVALCQEKHVVALDDKTSPADVVGRAVAVACREELKALFDQARPEWTDGRRERAIKEAEKTLAEQATVEILKRRAIQ